MIGISLNFMSIRIFLFRLCWTSPPFRSPPAALLCIDEVSACNPNVVKVVMDANRNAIYFSRALIPHSKSGQVTTRRRATTSTSACTAFRTPFLQRYCLQPISPLQASEDLEQLKVLEMGERIKMCVVDHAEPGIDTPEQLAAMDARLRALQ
jgi:3-deoxy-manno-octulosonate cytidylyltransferase (CMP-KDO synthetase)